MAVLRNTVQSVRYRSAPKICTHRYVLGLSVSIFCVYKIASKQPLRMNAILLPQKQCCLAAAFDPVGI